MRTSRRQQTLSTVHDSETGGLPADYPQRPIQRIVNEALKRLNDLFTELCRSRARLDRFREALTHAGFGLLTSPTTP